jgi:hypothetical protein
MITTNKNSNAAILPAIALSQRSANRFSLSRAGGLQATWVDEGNTVNATGTLGNISAGGFCAKMACAPPRGRILHARLDLETAKGLPTETIEADARVCGRTRFSNNRRFDPGWMVNFAIETMHPADEKLMARAINLIKTAAH